MIDTDKYEGHTIEGSSYNHRLMNNADIQLIADAPLLLEEVKRLRKQVELLEWAEKTHPAYLNNLKKGFKGYQNE